MTNPSYEQLAFMLNEDYLKFTLRRKRLYSFRLHLGEERVEDANGGAHHFDIVWFKDSEELIAVEIEESLGVVLPLNFRLKRSTDRYLFLGSFTEKGIDDLLMHHRGIIPHLWRLHTEESQSL